MSDVVISSAGEPDGASRIVSLDVLRGIAILAILFMNINAMGASFWAAFVDPRHLGWTSLDQSVWYVRQVLADGTARALLQMLFGAGMVILTDRAADAADDWPLMRRYYARNLVLWAFGLVHALVLMWPGDILHTYGIAALIAFLFRRLTPVGLLLAGLSLALVQLADGGSQYLGGMEQQAQVERAAAKGAAGAALAAPERELLDQEARRSERTGEPPAELRELIAAEDRGRTTTSAAWFATQWKVFLTIEGESFRFFGISFQPFEMLLIWEAAATMLVGAALYRWGVLQGLRSRRFYLLLTFASYAFGLPARAIGAVEFLSLDGLPHLSAATQELARLATAIGHIGVVHLLLGSAVGSRLLRPFEAAGRTALTIYFLQSIICLWILYPPFALGLYGQQGWASLMATAFAINAVLLAWANWWVRHYRIAPVEWAWRSLVERRVLPMRNRTASSGTDRAPHPA